MPTILDATSRPLRIIVSFVVGCGLFFGGVCGASAQGAIDGRILFQQKCSTCHTIGGGDRSGPDLWGSMERHSQDWLIRWITRPDLMIAERDPIAIELLEQFKGFAMENVGLTEADARAVIDHVRAETATTAPASATQAPPGGYPTPPFGGVQLAAWAVFLIFAGAIALVFGWVWLSTRNPQDVDVKRAYAVRRTFFFVVASLLLVVLGATLQDTPYAEADTKADRIVYVAARQFDFVYSLEPIVSTGDLANVLVVKRLELPAGATVEFRVTSLDVNHGFGLYGPTRQLLAQTQAMPGYVNRLRVRLDEPGQYYVFCLEYCATGHHLMQSRLVVK
ncbi:MAG: hypothetical protein A3H95_12540 [Acidobacteria bacterium RIFCSPLOWO2_02_FULL_64_15]|nr:MAG: hypothetical protein A3H95_12540 [Acidobacteria bacterium RIFCSPLOWO2_02_FULL_64_15]